MQDLNLVKMSQQEQFSIIYIRELSHAINNNQDAFTSIISEVDDSDIWAILNQSISLCTELFCQCFLLSLRHCCGGLQLTCPDDAQIIHEQPEKRCGGGLGTEAEKEESRDVPVILTAHAVRVAHFIIFMY